MNHKKSELYFLLILLVGIALLTYFIFKPFLYALILAVLFATVLAPVYKTALRITGERKGIAALLATAFVLIVVIVPISFLGIQIFQEATQLYSSLTQNGGATTLSSTIQDGLNYVKELIPFPVEFSFDFDQYLKSGLIWLIQYLGPLLANIAKGILGVFIFLMALYYLFIDGPRLKAAVMALSPLQDIHDKTIFNTLALAINSVMRGSITVALIQGFLTAIGFALFGVPNATLWGSVAAIAALIPGIGTALVLLPGVLFLFLSGETLFAVGLLVWGVIAVGMVDNLLGPKLVERGMKLHSFLILLSILGGIGFFGPLGLLLGPLVLSLLFALIEIYFTISKVRKAN
ncbi:MAG: AI-2E family transporter [bacterium]|nr:AI-2E family transporter [bacterium]